MAKIKAFDECDCDDLKSYCRWEGPPCTCGPNGPIMCEGAYCQEAYDDWYEEHNVTCECCNEIVDIDTCETFQDKGDGHKYCICEDCMIRGERSD